MLSMESAVCDVLISAGEKCGCKRCYFISPVQCMPCYSCLNCISLCWVCCGIWLFRGVVCGLVPSCGKSQITTKFCGLLVLSVSSCISQVYTVDPSKLWIFLRLYVSFMNVLVWYRLVFLKNDFRGKENADVNVAIFFPRKVYVLVCSVEHVCDCVGDCVLLIPCICDFTFYLCGVYFIVIISGFNMRGIVDSWYFTVSSILEGDSDCVTIGIMVFVMWYVYVRWLCYHWYYGVCDVVCVC